MRRFNRIPTLLISGLAVIVATVAVTFLAGDRAGTAQPPTRVAATYITDFRDDRRLAGVVDNIFIGRVFAQAGTTILDEQPETQFQVEVQESIKGSLMGKIVVNQQGGRDGDQVVVFDDDPLLKPGQTYLFATLLYEERGWQTLVPRHGDIPIADAQQRTSLVARFTKATQEQIPYTP